MEQVEEEEDEGQVKNNDAVDDISDGEEDEAGTSTAKKRDLAIRNQTQSSVAVSRPTEIAPKSANTISAQSGDPLEEKARKVPDSAIKKYWQGIEDLRKAPRGKILPFLLVPLFSFIFPYTPCFPPSPPFLIA